MFALLHLKTESAPLYVGFSIKTLSLTFMIDFDIISIPCCAPETISM